MYQVLARKLRPKNFIDVVGQNHITQSLQNAILKNKIGHAYIFSGTRGVGKTTIARIFAKAIRCESRNDLGNSCGGCRACLDFETSSSMDVLEIDGASNNSVDDIREIVLNVQYLPSFGKYKVYIIDEVHMLSTSAFNALLKTLEEPPAHVVFLFATTEPHKLPDTVLSRCQRFDLVSASVENLNDLLLTIIESEKISLSDRTLVHRICESGDGSYRDALSLLDQVLSFSGGGEITEDVLVAALGLPRALAIESLVMSMISCDLEECSNIYRNLLSENVSLINISKSILDRFYIILQNYNQNELSGKFRLAEIYWVYECFAKEINWSLESISPKKTTELLLQKLCLRRQVFKEQISLESSDEISSLRTKTEVKEEMGSQGQPEKVEIKVEKFKEVEAVIRPIETVEVKMTEEVMSAPEETKEVRDLTWLGFIEHLCHVAPASSSTLEQGNIIRPLVYDGESVSISLGFTNASKVFLDYLNEESSYKNLLKNISNFFNCEEKNIHLELELVEKEEEGQFESLAEINTRKDKEDIERQKAEILNDPLIIEAEKIFKSRIDKVILGKRQ